MLERLPGVVWAVDQELRFLGGSGADLAALGLRAGQLRGTTLYDYFQTRDDSFPPIAAARNALAGRRSTCELSWRGNTYLSIVDPLRDAAGEIIGCVAISVDMTERARQEARQAEELARYENYAQRVPAMLYQLSGLVDGSAIRVELLSSGARQIMGVEPAEAFADPILLLDRIHPEDRPQYYAQAFEAMRTESRFDFEFRALTPDGKVHWLRAMSAPEVLPNGDLRFHGVAVDISRQREREEALRRTKDEISEVLHQRVRDVSATSERLEREVAERARIEEELRNRSRMITGMLEAMPVIAFRLNSRGEVAQAEGAGLERFGGLDGFRAAFEEAARRNEPQEAVVAALGGANVRQTFAGVLRGEAWALETFLMADGEGLAGAHGFAFDITTRHQMERNLRRSEERWRALAETSSDAVLLLDKEGIIRYINRPLDGVDNSQVVGQPAIRFLPSYRHAEFHERLRHVLETGETISYETDGISPRQEPGWYAARLGPDRQDDRIIGAVMYVTDITQRKKAEQARLASEARWRTLMEAAHDAIVIVDAETRRVVEANATMLELSGRTPEELALVEHERLYAREYVERVARMFEQFADAGHGLIRDVQIEAQDGLRIPVEVSLRWIAFGGRRLVIGILRDVTERMRAEQNLRNEERLLRELLNLHERDRRLLAYDIHDGFVQDVVGAHLAVEGLASRLEGQDPEVVEELSRLRMLLRNAIDEGRRMISDLRPMIIDERGIIDAINYLIGEHQRHGGPDIHFDHDVTFQRLSPLVEGAMFRIVQEALNNVRRHSSASEAIVRLVQQDGRVRLVIRDDGIGFDVKKVPTDRFGLRGMKERARLFGGHASIRSRPGEGTEVHVELPMEPYLADESA